MTKSEYINGQKYIMPSKPGICVLKPLPGVNLKPDRSNEPQMDLFVTNAAIEEIIETNCSICDKSDKIALRINELPAKCRKCLYGN